MHFVYLGKFWERSISIHFSFFDVVVVSIFKVLIGGNGLPVDASPRTQGGGVVVGVPRK